LIQQWNRIHPNNKVDFVELPQIADATHSEMVARAQSGAAIDVYNLDVTWTAEFAQAGYLRPLDETRVDEEGFVKKLLETCRYRDKLWALPFNSDAALLFYRNDPGLVSALPTRWQQIVDETQQVFAGPRPPKLVAGYTSQLFDYEG